MASVTTWQRIEPRSRSDDFSESLQAKIRDPLWMLTRQWQLGELDGDDAGSPVLVEMNARHWSVTHCRDKNGAAIPLAGAGPLESIIEREQVPMDLRTRVQVGLQFGRFLDAEQIGGRRATFLAVAPLETGSIAAEDRAGVRFAAAVRGKAIDGGKLLSAIEAGTDLWTLPPSGGGTLPPALRIDDPGEQAKVSRAAAALKLWFEKTYARPQLSTWKTKSLDYAAGASLDGGAPQLSVGEYSGGSLDWYHFDKVAALPTSGGAPISAKLVPTAVQYPGMPATRFWEMEDGLTDFGAVEAGEIDLGKLALAEFGLIGGDDWFVIPIHAPCGSLLRLESLVVSNVFGERITIAAAGSQAAPAGARWGLFGLATAGSRAKPEPTLFLPPTAVGPIEGRPIEELLFMRDEAANLAWAIERTLPGVLTEPLPAWDPQRAPPRPSEEDVPLRYRLMTAVAESWHPLQPVRLTGSNRQIALQLTPMLRETTGGTLEPIEPRGRILREGTRPLRIDEEAVPRTPLLVEVSFQRARDANGKTYLWLGRKKSNAAPQRGSALVFDGLEEKLPK